MSVSHTHTHTHTHRGPTGGPSAVRGRFMKTAPCPSTQKACSRLVRTSRTLAWCRARHSAGGYQRARSRPSTATRCVFKQKIINGRDRAPVRQRGVCKRVCRCECVFVTVCVSVCVNCVYASRYVCMFVMHVCMYGVLCLLCMYACMHACMYVCVCVCVCTHTYIHTYI